MVVKVIMVVRVVMLMMMVMVMMVVVMGMMVVVVMMVVVLMLVFMVMMVVVVLMVIEVLMVVAMGIIVVMVMVMMVVVMVMMVVIYEGDDESSSPGGPVGGRGVYSAERCVEWLEGGERAVDECIFRATGAHSSLHFIQSFLPCYCLWSHKQRVDSNTLTHTPLYPAHTPDS